MLNRIEAVSPRGDLLSLPLDDSATGLLIQGEVGGLGPVKAEIVSSTFANLPGSQYQSSRRGERNIILPIGFEPDWAEGEEVMDLRDRAYDYFMTEMPIGLRFFDTKKQPRYISGRVESCDPDMFTDDPKVNVSIICNNPDFYDPTPVVQPWSTVSTTTNYDLDYDGTVSVGVKFNLHINRALTAFTIYHEAPDGTLGIMDFSETFQNGDELEVSTVRGNKYIRLNRGGVVSSMLRAVSPQSNWIELQPGPNTFRVYATGAAINYDLEYMLKYGGL